MTLGKIERFWKTIYEEFLIRAQFVSLRKPRRGSGMVQYYNHKRRTRGLEVCALQTGTLRSSRAAQDDGAGDCENALEMALRGKPREPFTW